MTSIEKIIHGERWPEFGQIARLHNANLDRVEKAVTILFSSLEAEVERPTARIAELEAQVAGYERMIDESYDDRPLVDPEDVLP
jgi:hypothetical protein